MQLDLLLNNVKLNFCCYYCSPHAVPSWPTRKHCPALCCLTVSKLFQGKPDILTFHEGSSSVCSCSFILLFIGVNYPFSKFK